MRAIILFLSTVLAAGPAAASGGFSCSAEDDAVTIDVNGGVTHGMGSPVFSLQGEIEIRDDAVSGDLRKTDFERIHLAQYWLDASELRLVLYREREGNQSHGYVQLTVKTASEDNGTTVGDYVLEVFDMAGAVASEGKTESFGGKVICSVE